MGVYYSYPLFEIIGMAPATLENGYFNKKVANEILITQLVFVLLTTQ
ncbi:hypothetical protein M2419_004679 [Sphingobacterium sp. BIGb0116]|nr:hypothetical protein [Sphingobacterium sp. BIGb0116]